MAADELRSAASHGLLRRLLNLTTLVFGGIGFVSGLWVLWRQRHQARIQGANG
jgi:hypothetical protein